MTTRNWLNQQDKTVNLGQSPYLIEESAVNPEVFNQNYMNRQPIPHPYPVHPHPSMDPLGTHYPSMNPMSTNYPEPSKPEPKESLVNSNYIAKQRTSILQALACSGSPLQQIQNLEEYATLDIKGRVGSDAQSGTLNTMVIEVSTRGWVEYLEGLYRVPGLPVSVCMVRVSSAESTCLALGGLFFDGVHDLFVRPLRANTQTSKQYTTSLMIYYNSKQLGVENKINQLLNDIIEARVKAQPKTDVKEKTKPTAKSQKQQEPTT